MSNATEEIRRALVGKNPLIYVQTWEEERALRLLESFAAKLYKGERSLTTWTCFDNFSKAANIKRSHLRPGKM